MTFRTVLWRMAARVGMAPHDLGGLPMVEAVQMTEAINSALDYSWNRYDWPPLCPVEETTPSQDPRGTAYLPAANFTTVFGIYRTDPIINPTPPIQMVELPTGWHFADNAGVPVWVRHRPAPPVFTGVDWEIDITYAPGALVYAGDECWIAGPGVASSTGAPPYQALFDWTKLIFPAFLAEPVMAGAFALYQHTEGQHGTAALLGEAADGLLDEVQDRYEFSGGRNHKQLRK